MFLFCSYSSPLAIFLPEINYSMDKTTYFSTLDQYKYNPAIIISSEIGSEVIASATGVVRDISVDAQTGTTLTLDIGNGFELVYGQLNSFYRPKQIIRRRKGRRCNRTDSGFFRSLFLFAINF